MTALGLREGEKNIIEPTEFKPKYNRRSVHYRARANILRYLSEESERRENVIEAMKKENESLKNRLEEEGV